MARARGLRNPPIQEAVMQFVFAGAELSHAQLDSLAAQYIGDGWQKQELRTFEATFTSSGTEVVAAAEGAFLGFMVTSPDGTHLVQLRATQVSGSTRKYVSWEELTSHAEVAFNAFVAAANPTHVSRLSARFINRIPGSDARPSFGQILARPPLPLEGLQGAEISDFLRRHIVTGLEGGFSASLTIGNVPPEGCDGHAGKPMVIDTDVYKACEVAPRFDLLKADLAVLRSIKNTLFFGSLQEAVVEEFE